MLEINMEFRKGILFVRLEGVLNIDTYQELDSLLGPMISNDDIRYVVLNLENLKIIAIEEITKLLRFDFNLKKKGGRIIICGGIDKIIENKRKGLEHILYINNELEAMNIVNM